ncbi:hypothetical protein [Streptacidiphilus anmyonensis]|uniref:hypothetical protein n=1 Tax=Streptacidiphilus anmyonensis TaxID=405782 RepID=UPI0005A78B6B|nr:hypothetical protein [Streptacidiphilus anmyonensis]
MYGPASPSPLHDPTVQAAIAAEKAQSRQPFDALPEGPARAVELLLTHCPWQEYGYRYGRWQRQTEEELVWFPVNRWVRTKVMQLVDLHSGAPVAEVYPYSGIGGPPQFEPAGRVWVCGSPNSVAALIPVGADQREIALARARHTMFNDEWLLARTLVHGQEKPAPRPYQERRLYQKSTWVADCPQKPTKQDGFEWRYFQVDEGLLHGEARTAHWEDQKLWKALRATGL